MNRDTSGITRRTALLALGLTMPFPTLGAAMQVLIAPGLVGTIAAAICKAWVFALPLWWVVKVQKQKLSIPPLRRDGMITATILGIAIFIIMVAAYFTIARGWIDQAMVRQRAAKMHIDNWFGLLALFAYLTLINSLLEEYFWRWFIVRQCETLVTPIAAIVLSAGLFTIHHIVAMTGWVPWHANLLGALGVFVGGASWSWLYVRYRNIWTPYLAHIFADAAILVIAWDMLVR